MGSPLFDKLKALEQTLLLDMAGDISLSTDAVDDIRRVYRELLSQFVLSLIEDIDLELAVEIYSPDPPAVHDADGKEDAPHNELLRIRTEEMAWPGGRKMPAYVFAGWLGFKSTKYNQIEGGDRHTDPPALRKALKAAHALTLRDDLQELCRWSHTVYLHAGKNNSRVNDAISNEADRQANGGHPAWRHPSEIQQLLDRRDLCQQNENPIPDRPFNPRPASDE
jgi:hypothetical protein